MRAARGPLCRLLGRQPARPGGRARRHVRRGVRGRDPFVRPAPSGLGRLLGRGSRPSAETVAPGTRIRVCRVPACMRPVSGGEPPQPTRRGHLLGGRASVLPRSVRGGLGWGRPHLRVAQRRPSRVRREPRLRVRAWTSRAVQGSRRSRDGNMRASRQWVHGLLGRHRRGHAPSLAKRLPLRLRRWLAAVRSAIGQFDCLLEYSPARGSHCPARGQLVHRCLGGGIPFLRPAF